MRVLVNALSIGSLSGRHVLFGHLRQLAKWTLDRHEFVVLLDRGDQLPRSLNFANIRTQQVDARSRGAFARTIWESWHLPRLIQSLKAQLYLSCSGTILTRCPVPQATIAPNPWCMVSAVHRGWSERFKAAAQRWAYRHAVRHADFLAYISHHLRSLYLQNAAPSTERSWGVAYLGINDDTWEAAATAQALPRDRWTILSVSAMAPWKGALNLLDATALLAAEGLPVKLRLVGPWPNRRYEQQVRHQIAQHQLEDRVTITGQVSNDQLHQEYARAGVYCLLSQCESFGIPALEAQAFGTPVVGSNVCAMPEICGEGGDFCSPHDVTAASQLLKRMLIDEDYWRHKSDLSRTNASRFRWDDCSRPLMSMFDLA